MGVNIRVGGVAELVLLADIGLIFAFELKKELPALDQ